MNPYQILSELVDQNKELSTKDKIKKYAAGSIFPVITGGVAAGTSQIPLENKEISELEEQIVKEKGLPYWKEFKNSSIYQQYRKRIYIERTKHISISAFKGAIIGLFLYAFSIFMKRMKKKHDEAMEIKRLKR